mmetsp:Transcript_35168/g.69328  ORF Transcript_35168/g.69328 Transcript_35168/m.69328 type:complete len:122 (-) Transcript_35168:1513-1878(-)
MMATASHKENDLSVIEHRRYDRKIRQVGSPRKLGMVRQENIPLAYSFAALTVPIFHLEAHSLLHGTKVDGNVGGVGNQPSFGSEEGAREIQPLLDVDRRGSACESTAHLLRDAHESVAEDG